LLSAFRAPATTADEVLSAAVIERRTSGSMLGHDRGRRADWLRDARPCSVIVSARPHHATISSRRRRRRRINFVSVGDGRWPVMPHSSPPASHK